MTWSGLYSRFRWSILVVDAEGLNPAAQRYGWSVERDGSLYTEPGVTGTFGVSATSLEAITIITKYQSY